MTELTLSWDEWINHDATSMAALVKAGKVTPQELAAQAAAANALINPHINAVREFFDDLIEDPFKDGMNPEGPFVGVPILVKDLGSAMKGRKQESGFAFLKGYVAPKDDPLITNFRKAGFNLIGRTNVPPMGFAAQTESILHGVTRNPWHLDYTPSGSSGGSAAALAARITPIVTASDGGGSIRSPAGWNALIGLKPTRGRLPLPPSVGNEYNVGHVAEGVLTHTVRDTAAVLDYISKHRPGDSFIPIAKPAIPYKEVIHQPLKPLKIALITGGCGRSTPVVSEVMEPVKKTANALASLGHIIEEVDSNELCNWSEFWPHVDVTWIGSTRFWPEIAAAYGREITEDTLESVYHYLIEAGQAYEWNRFRAARAANAVYTREFGTIF